jgi:hypothetical protein
VSTDTCVVNRWARCPHGHQDCCGHHDAEDNQLHPQPWRLHVRNTGEVEAVRPPFRPIDTDEPYETVVAPRHYRLPGGIEVFDLIEGLPFCLGSAIKYLLRAGRKPAASADEDLKKAAVCLQREIDRRARAYAEST